MPAGSTRSWSAGGLARTPVAAADPSTFQDGASIILAMGVQPPADDIAEKPDVIEFGIAALDAELPDSGLSFPLDSADLAEAHGDLSIPVDAAGNEMRLTAALEECDRDTFESRQDLLNELHPVFEARREAVSNSVLAQLRTLVPF